MVKLVTMGDTCVCVYACVCVCMRVCVRVRVCLHARVRESAQHQIMRSGGARVSYTDKLQLSTWQCYLPVRCEHFLANITFLVFAHSRI